MPELNTRSRTAPAVIEPLSPVRENRIDPPHRMANGRDDERPAGAARDAAKLPAGGDADVEVASLAMVQQLRLQAQQLSVHLGQQQADLDRREAELQAQAAQLEQQERNNRLWLRDRHEELAEREAAIHTHERGLQDLARQTEQLEQNQLAQRRTGDAELDARREGLDRREAAIRDADEHVRERLLEVEAARVALEDASQAHEELVRDLERRMHTFDARRGVAVEMISRFLAGEAILPARPKRAARGEAAAYVALQQRSPNTPSGHESPRELPPMRDEFDELADLLTKLQSRREHLAEVEALLRRAESEVAELRQTLLADRKLFDAERQSERRRHEDLRRRAEADLTRRRDALESASQQLELRRAAVEQMRAELTMAQREALENRLVAEELLAQLAGAIPPAQLSHQVARSRARLADCFRLQQDGITDERRQLESLALAITEQHERVAVQKRELEQWLRQQTTQAETDAARLAERESQIDRQRDLVERQRFDWEHERQEYQHQIRRLLAELGQ